MSNLPFDSQDLAAPIARPLAFLVAADESNLSQRAEEFVEGLLRYLAIVALRGAFAHDPDRASRTALDLSKPASKGAWLQRLRESLALWDEVGAVALLGPEDASALGFPSSRAHAALAKLVAVRNAAKYRGSAVTELRLASYTALAELFGLREHRLFVPRQVESSNAGVKRYRATLYRGHAEPFPTIHVETELELDPGRVYLGRRGSRDVLPLDPLVLEAQGAFGRELFVVEAADSRRVTATALVSRVALDSKTAHEARERLDLLATAFAPDRGWKSARCLSSDDELPAGLRRYRPSERIASRYVIESFIDSGGSADVYLAHDEQREGRAVALKVLPYELARSTTNLAKLGNEVRIARGARHPNLIEILDHGLDRGDAFLVLELATGVEVGGARARDLAALLEARKRSGLGPLGEVEVRSLADDLARGLGALHAARILHRDVKPGNVLLFEGEPRAKLGDFGISRASNALTTTREGFRVGTARYLAPERIDPSRASEVGPPSDVYAFGCVLYEALTLRPPFDAETEREIEAQHLSLRPTSLRELRPDVSPSLAALVHRCLAKSPAQRPSSADELLRMLDGSLAVDLDPVVAPPSSRGDEGTLRRRRPRLALASGALAVTLGAALWIGVEDAAVAHARRDLESEVASLTRVGRPDAALDRLRLGLESIALDPPLASALFDAALACESDPLGRDELASAFAALGSAEDLDRKSLSQGVVLASREAGRELRLERWVASLFARLDSLHVDEAIGACAVAHELAHLTRADPRIACAELSTLAIEHWRDDLPEGARRDRDYVALLGLWSVWESLKDPALAWSSDERLALLQHVSACVDELRTRNLALFFDQEVLQGLVLAASSRDDDSLAASAAAQLARCLDARLVERQRSEIVARFAPALRARHLENVDDLIRQTEDALNLLNCVPDGSTHR